MKRRILILILVCIIAVLLSISFFIPSSSPPTEVEIGIFYYVWYNPSWEVSWEYPKICDKPVLGYYNSCNTTVIRQHLVWLKDLRIDFAVISWWGFYNQSEWNSFVNNATHQIFKTAKENGVNIKLCVMVEPFNETNQSLYDFTEIYHYVYNNFVTPYQTIYYQRQEKPVICFFNKPNLTPNGTIPKDNRFTVKIVGEKAYSNWVYTDLIQVEGPIPRDKQISVTPRYAPFGNPNPVDVNLSEGVYDEEWERAIKLANQNAIDVITICSWNEYPERTAIEPHSDTTTLTANSYFLYNKTKRYIAELKNKH